MRTVNMAARTLGLRRTSRTYFANINGAAYMIFAAHEGGTQQIGFSGVRYPADVLNAGTPDHRMGITV